MAKRSSGEAYKVAREAYPFRCCVVCGLQIEGLTVAHLDHDPGQNDPDNLHASGAKSRSGQRRLGRNAGRRLRFKVVPFGDLHQRLRAQVKVAFAP